MKKLWLSLLAAALMAGLVASCEDCENCDDNNNEVTRDCEPGSGAPCNCDLADPQATCPNSDSKCMPMGLTTAVGVCATACGNDSNAVPLSGWDACPDTGFGGLDACVYEQDSVPFCGLICVADEDCPQNQICGWFPPNVPTPPYKTCQPDPIFAFEAI